MQGNENYLNYLNIQTDSVLSQCPNDDLTTSGPHNKDYQSLKSQYEQSKLVALDTFKEIILEKASRKQNKRKGIIKSMDFTVAKSSLRNTPIVQKNISPSNIKGKLNGKSSKKKTKSQVNFNFLKNLNEIQNINSPSNFTFRPQSTEPKMLLSNKINSQEKKYSNSKQSHQQYKDQYSNEQLAQTPTTRRQDQKQKKQQNKKENATRINKEIKLFDFSSSPKKAQNLQASSGKKQKAPKLKISNMKIKTEEAQQQTHSLINEIKSNLFVKKEQNSQKQSKYQLLKKNIQAQTPKAQINSIITPKLPSSTKAALNKPAKPQEIEFQQQDKEVFKKHSKDILLQSHQINKFQRDKLKNINKKFCQTQNLQNQPKTINTMASNVIPSQNLNGTKSNKMLSDQLLIQRISKQCKFQLNQIKSKQVCVQREEKQKFLKEINFYKKLMFFGKGPFIKIIEFTDQLLFPFTNIKIKYILSKHQEIQMNSNASVTQGEKK